MSRPLHLLLSSPEKYLVKNVKFWSHTFAYLSSSCVNISWEIPHQTCDVRFEGQKSRNVVAFKDSSIVRYDAVSVRK
jgi:hypothetical protein